MTSALKSQPNRRITMLVRETIWLSDNQRAKQSDNQIIRQPNSQRAKQSDSWTTREPNNQTMALSVNHANRNDEPRRDMQLPWTREAWAWPVRGKGSKKDNVANWGMFRRKDRRSGSLVKRRRFAANPNGTNSPTFRSSGPFDGPRLWEARRKWDVVERKNGI